MKAILCVGEQEDYVVPRKNVNIIFIHCINKTGVMSHSGVQYQVNVRIKLQVIIILRLVVF